MRSIKQTWKNCWKYFESRIGHPKQKKAVFICCDDQYIPKSIIALKCFSHHNPDFNVYIITSALSDENKDLCFEYDITPLVVDLSKDFDRLDERPYGKQYPLECFYHFYAYKLLKKYSFAIQIEPDVFTQRALNLDWDAIEFVGGTSVNNYTIDKFFSILRDLDVLKKHFPNLNVHQNKLISGFRIYNTRNLAKVNYYEEIVRLYKKSWDLGIPRSGDDSLNTLYQAIHPEHFTILDSKFHLLYPHSYALDNIRDIVHFHFSGPNPKWWTDERPGHPMTLFFKSRFIEFLYNQFPVSFIENYCKELYVPIDHPSPVSFYYWNGAKNFGDWITPYFLNKFCRSSDYRFDFKNEVRPKVLACGSIMRLCNKKSIVYGSGIRNADQEVQCGHFEIVRGPLTRKRLMEVDCDCPPVYGDPALLLPLYYMPAKKGKRFNVGIIPHVIQYERVFDIYKDNNECKVIDLGNENIEEVVDQMSECHCIVSASLHGLIVSDAYRIPNKWIQFSDEIFGDNTKFYDYFLSVQRVDQEFIDARNYKKLDIRSVIQRIGPVQIDFDFQYLRDRMFFNEKGITPYVKYLYATMQSDDST